MVEPRVELALNSYIDMDGVFEFTEHCAPSSPENRKVVSSNTGGYGSVVELGSSVIAPGLSLPIPA
jgi:hypothetical protein